MTAGKLRERVAFEKRDPIDDGYGNEQSGEWAEQFEVWGRVLPLKGSEAVMADRLSGRQPVVVQVRYSDTTAAVEPGWRARVKTGPMIGKLLNITGAANMDERTRYLDILAVAGTGQ